MLTARVHSYPLVCPERGPGLDYISMMVNDLYVTLRFLPQHILDSYISPLLAPSTSSERARFYPPRFLLIIRETFVFAAKLPVKSPDFRL
ncbi:hypothetical protein Zmor_002707 [Zophobas morio]|uniref:Uncharacterized protein n=1 Tax=Zophobas morio TaxID=2755281 RepID=A0AA38HQI2_9CUCU|nr:hypothetical protein Zmor_002707 [Zophobas morio]